MLGSVHDLRTKSMIQGKADDAQTCGKTRKPRAAQTRIQGKPTLDDRRAAQPERRRRQDDARPASRRPMGPAREADYPDRRRPTRLALDWSEQRARRRYDRLFGVIGLARDTLHREAPELARDARHLIIDGPPRIAGLMRSALLAADLALIPVQPSPSTAGHRPRCWR